MIAASRFGQRRLVDRGHDDAIQLPVKGEIKSAPDTAQRSFSGGSADNSQGHWPLVPANIDYRYIARCGQCSREALTHSGKGQVKHQLSDKLGEQVVISDQNGVTQIADLGRGQAL